MKVAVLLTALAGIVSLASSLSPTKTSHNDLLLIEWDEFKETHGKAYKNSADEDRRFQIYLNTRLAVAKHNHEHALGRQSYRQKINKFADILTDELVGAGSEREINFENSPNMRKLVPNASLSDSLPESIDWRLQGAVTPVETQGSCGSSWAFATTGILEAWHMLKLGELVSLSAQQLIDCSKDNEGCDGGDTYFGMKYLMDIEGIQDAHSYTYTGKKGDCAYNSSKVVDYVQCFEYGGGPEYGLKDMVSDGPVAAVLTVADSFKHYEYGVYSEANCTKGPRQSVLVVGYGTTYEEGDYWIVKNSWGRDWGEFGYMRIARNANMCGISDLNVQPCY